MINRMREDLKGSFITSAGWLFADMLLLLFVLFLALSTIEPAKSNTRPKTIPPPTLTVKPTSLNPMDTRYCKGGISKPQCTVTLGETASSQGNVDWTVSNDMSGTVISNPEKGTLSPGESINVLLSVLTCQNGSFTFWGLRVASPVTVLWRCTVNGQLLERTYCTISLTTADPYRFSRDEQYAKTQIAGRISSLPFLQNRLVGIAIAYGGANDGDNERGKLVAIQIYAVLKGLASFKTASFYEPLIAALRNPDEVIIDVFLLASPNHPSGTCNETTHRPLQ